VTRPEGRLADVLLLDGDPTPKVSIMQDRACVVAAVQDGSFHRAPPCQMSEAVGG